MGVQSYEAKLSQKEQQVHDKDVLINNLNMLLDKRNHEVDTLKSELKLQTTTNDKLEKDLNHAIDSKMKSLVQSQSEISKLKKMLKNGYLSEDNGYRSHSQSADTPVSLMQFHSTPIPVLSNGYSSSTYLSSLSSHFSN